MHALSTIVCCTAVLLLLCGCRREDAGLAEIFANHGIEGTIIISSLDGTKEYVHNRERAEQRFLPASTFKIPNSLIALHEGAIGNADEVIPWDSVERFLPSWNRDQTLASAFPISCVWFYQELARRVGNEAYLEHLAAMPYGNRLTGADVSTFWLEGDIAISAREQIDFLKKLYREELNFSKEHHGIVKRIMIRDQNPQYTLRAKTGWAKRIDSQHGWFVGYVEAGTEVWFFATNIVIRAENELRFRQQLSMEALGAKGIISPQQ